MQQLKPIATVSNTGWSIFGGATVHEVVGEGTATPGDTETSFVFTATVGATFEVGIEGGLDPGCRHGHNVAVQIRRHGGPPVSEPQVILRVKSGGNIISQRLQSIAQGGTWFTYENFMPASATATIPSYAGGLTLEVEVATCEAGCSIRLSALDLNVPNPGSLDPAFDPITYGAGLHYKQQFRTWVSKNPRFSFPGGLRPAIVKVNNSGLATSPIDRVLEPTDGLLHMLYEDGFICISASMAHVGMSVTDPNIALIQPPVDLALFRPIDGTPGSKWLTTPFAYKDVFDLFAMIRRQALLPSGALFGLVNPEFVGGFGRSGGAHCLSIAALARNFSGLFGVTAGGNTRPDFAIMFQEAAFWFPAWLNNIAPFFPKDGVDYTQPNVTMQEVPVSMRRIASPGDIGFNEAAYPGVRTINKTARHYVHSASGPIESSDYDDGSETAYTGQYPQEFMTIAHSVWNAQAHIEALRELEPTNKGPTGFRSRFVTGQGTSGFNEDKIIDLVSGDKNDPVMKDARAWALLGALSWGKAA